MDFSEKGMRRVALLLTVKIALGNDEWRSTITEEELRTRGLQSLSAERVNLLLFPQPGELTDGWRAKR